MLKTERRGKTAADISFSFGAAMGNEISARESERYKSAARAAQKRLNETPPKTAGYGWMILPDTPADEILEQARLLARYDNIVQVGIGGSALGNLMLNQALLDGFRNETGNKPGFYLADNPDPDKVLSIWRAVKDGKTALVGVSKSGATAETMTQFLWFRREMLANGQSDDDIFVITDPESGVFRAFANNSNCRAANLPSSVGGRYSVLSSAGLIVAAALGIDVGALLSGAASMKAFLTGETSFEKNPAMKLAAIHMFHEGAGRNMSVLMPYSSKMAYFAEWYAQLWAESLGKGGKGTTPIRALGAIDQHSQVQLYTEGPDDKFFTVISVKDHGAEVKTPEIKEEALSPLRYLGGREIGEMLNLEAQSTAAAIIKNKRPLMWIETARIDARTLGELIFFYEYLTALTGLMMNVNPFDQPGVEQGKKYTYGLMGRDGYGRDACEVREWFAKIEEDKIVF